MTKITPYTPTAKERLQMARDNLIEAGLAISTAGKLDENQANYLKDWIRTENSKRTAEGRELLVSGEITREGEIIKGLRESELATRRSLVATRPAVMAGAFAKAKPTTEDHGATAAAGGGGASGMPTRAIRTGAAAAPASLSTLVTSESAIAQAASSRAAAPTLEEVPGAIDDGTETTPATLTSSSALRAGRPAATAAGGEGVVTITTASRLRRDGGEVDRDAFLDVAAGGGDAPNPRPAINPHQGIAGLVRRLIDSLMGRGGR